MKEISNYKIKILNTKFDSIMLDDFCNKNSIILNYDYLNEINCIIFINACEWSKRSL